MTRDETKNILKLCCNYFPNFTPKDPAGMVEAWFGALNVYEFSEVEKAVGAYACANKFFPSVGDIRLILDGKADGFNNFRSRIRDSKFFEDLEKEMCL